MKIKAALTILCAILSMSAMAEFTPQNTLVITDLDNVLIDKSAFLESIAQLKLVLTDYKKDKNGVKETLQDKKGNHISGLTFHLLYHGMRKYYLTAYTAWMVHNLEKSRQLNQDMLKIYKRLHEKGYPIVFATNKDRIAYDIIAQTFGSEFTDLADKVFVCHPGNNPDFLAQLQDFANQSCTPQSYKDLLNQAINIQSTETIFHVPMPKPDPNYFRYVQQHFPAGKNSIFIDDKLSNVQGFNEAYQPSTMQNVGIAFKSSPQLAQELVKLNLLSEKDDADLLEDIRHPGIWGKMKLSIEKMFPYPSLPEAQKE